MSKQRTRQQILEQISKAKLEKILSEWIVNPITNDFGFDYEVRITEPNTLAPGKQYVTGSIFQVQLKSTDDDCEVGFFEDLSVNDINLFIKNNNPVVLIKYYAKCDLLFYEIIHSYVWNVIDREDPKWKERGHKRIQLTKQLNDLDELKNELQDVQVRIIRNVNYYNTGLGEGIDFSDFDSFREKDLLEFKYKTLRVAFSEIQSGSEEKGIAYLEEVYKCPKDDKLKFNATINLVLQLNPLNLINHEKLIDYAEAGVGISKKVGEDDFIDFFILTIHNIYFIQVLIKISQVLYSKKISQMSAGDFSPFYDAELIRLYQIQNEINKEIQTSIEKIFNTKNIQVLVFSLSTIMETITFQMQRFSLIDEKYLQIEIDHKRPLIDGYEKIISQIHDEYSIQFGCYQLATYYFWTCNYNKSERYISRAIEISMKLGYKNNIEFYKRLLSDIRNEKSPSDPKNVPKMNVDDLTFVQYRDVIIKNLELQGMDVSITNITGDPTLDDAIRTGLEDFDPSEYLRHCENLRIAYIGTSLVGQNIGLFSLGSKIVWCKKTGAIQGFSLKRIARSFIEDKCKDCDMKKSRDKYWICTIKLLDEMNTDPCFVQFVKKMEESNSKM